MRDVGWRPGLLGQLRALVRRALVVMLGTRGEQLLHRTYHRALRTAGRFGPPEDATTISLLSAIAAPIEDDHRHWRERRTLHVVSATTCPTGFEGVRDRTTPRRSDAPPRCNGESSGMRCS